jgi:hypothetical protein
MANLTEIMNRMRAIIDERERALDNLKLVLNNLENLAATLSADELLAFEKSLNSHDSVKKVFEPKRQRGIVPPAEVAAAAKTVLLNARRPMRRGELVFELEKIGIPLAGKDKNKNIGTILWRHKNEFIQIDNLGYWLKGVPLEGIYTPQE